MGGSPQRSELGRNGDTRMSCIGLASTCSSGFLCLGLKALPHEFTWGIKTDYVEQIREHKVMEDALGLKV